MLTNHQQPKQLELFPTAVRLTKVVLEDNQWQFYLMRTTPTLFGGVVAAAGMGTYWLPRPSAAGDPR